MTWSCDVLFHLRLIKRLSKQSWGWWFETPSRPLWRHRNGQEDCQWGMGHGISLSLALSLHIYIYIYIYIVCRVNGGGGGGSGGRGVGVGGGLNWELGTPHTPLWAQVTGGYFPRFSYATDNPYLQRQLNVLITIETVKHIRVRRNYIMTIWRLHIIIEMKLKNIILVIIETNQRHPWQSPLKPEIGLKTFQWNAVFTSMQQ